MIMTHDRRNYFNWSMGRTAVEIRGYMYVKYKPVRLYPA